MTTTLKAWEPSSVLIPEDAAWKNAVGEVNVDPELCTLLFLDGDRERGELFTKEEWEAGMRPVYTLHDDKYWKVVNGEEKEFCRAGLSIKDQEPVPFPRIQLLPDMWVLKVDETQYWNGLDAVRVKRVFGVYVLNKRKAVYMCELTPSYEMHRLESQYEPEWTFSEPNTDSLHEKAMDWIRDGEVHDDPTTYFHCSDVERMLSEQVLQPHVGDLPKGKAGGYRWVGMKAVTEDEALEEIREATCNGDL